MVAMSNAISMPSCPNPAIHGSSPVSSGGCAPATKAVGAQPAWQSPSQVDPASEPRYSREMSDAHAARRQTLMERLGPGAGAVIGGRVTSRRNSDVEYRFRQPSDLLYLTGFSEPDALAVLSPRPPSALVLLLRPRSEPHVPRTR